MSLTIPGRVRSELAAVSTVSRRVHLPRFSLPNTCAESRAFSLLLPFEVERHSTSRRELWLLQTVLGCTRSVVGHGDELPAFLSPTRNSPPMSHNLDCLSPHRHNCFSDGTRHKREWRELTIAEIVRKLPSDYSLFNK